MSQKENAVKNKFELTNILAEGKFFGAITLLGYIAAYFYKLGYFKHFGIPQEFIVVDFSSIFVAVISIIGVIFLYLSVIDPFYKQLFHPKTTLEFRIRNFALIIAYIMVRLIIYKSFVDLGFTMIFLFTWLSMSFFFPFSFKNVKTYTEQMEADELRIENENRKSTIANMFKILGTSFRIIFIATIFIIFISYDIGRSVAFTKDTFPVINLNKKQLIILSYQNDGFLIMPLDYKKNTLTKELIILRNTVLSEKQIPIAFIKLGRLN